MACFFPINAWRYPIEGSKLHFKYKAPPYEPLRVPCGTCEGCRADQSLMWSIRAYHESTLHFKNSFITLTYDDDHLPSDGKIVKKHLQDFFKRLRKNYPAGTIRYIACGEYGELYRRPHYHAIIFGEDWRDGRRDLDQTLYTNDRLESVWGQGNVSIGAVSMASICYVCGYTFKKIGDAETFSLASRRPPIGHNWLDQFRMDISNTGQVSIEGRVYPVPSRYLEWMPEEFEHIKKERKEYALKNAHKGTDYALSSKRKAKQHQIKNKRERI